MTAKFDNHCPTHKSCLGANSRTAKRAQQRRRDKLVAACMPLVKRLAGRISRRVRHKVSTEDIISWGVTGLLEAIDRYVPGGKATLETFAYYRIRGAMLDGIGQIAPLSRKGYRSARAADDKRAIYNESLSEQEFADTKQKNAEELATENEQADIIGQAIAKLSAPHQHLVREFYFKNRSLQEAGTDIGISKSWASRSHANALGLLREELQESLCMAA